ncbi:hypothetical protein [Ramlibacter sp.]|uniref:hypothetical protein n=1 Tax=Ramlibacter sp. TaxID=1917967 RepID=UPI003D112E37
MPHPKRHLKLSGDIHLPDVDEDLDPDIDGRPVASRPSDTSLEAENGREPAANDLAILAVRRDDKPFWHRDTSMKTMAAFGLAIVLLSMLAGGRRRR